jgi:hypothetical protein
MQSTDQEVHMKSVLLRCKACGYIATESSLGASCPACGVPRSSFAEYSDRVSQARRRWLTLHIHQVSVHLPQAFSIFMLPAVIIGYYWPSFPVIGGGLIGAAELIGSVFPLVVIAGFLTGLADGKMRYRKLKTPFLIIKIVAGLVFMLVSSALSAIILTTGIVESTVLPVAGLSLVALGCSLILGKLGGMIACSVMGGSQ